MKAIVLGAQLAAGAILAICLWITATSMVEEWTTPRDDCDSPSERCGMKVLTDHKTGLQYLKAPGGGITPRLTVAGDHMREDGQ